MPETKSDKKLPQLNLTNKSGQKANNSFLLFKQKLGLGILILSFIAGIWWTGELLRKYRPKNNLTIATFAKEGEYYAFGQAFSQIVAKHNPSISIKVLATKGSVENQQLLHQGHVDLALIQSDTPLEKETRVIAFLFPEVFHLIVRGESKINQVKDLKEKRIALMPKGSRSYALFWELIAHYGLDEDDVKPISLSLSQANEALNQGDVDALFIVTALRNEALLKLLENPEINLVPIDQAKALQLVLPSLEATTIPKGTYNGAIPIPKQDLSSVAVRAVLITHSDLDSSVVYKITRILFEAKSDLATQYSKAVMIPMAKSLPQGGFIFHSGAKTYYDQDKPSFWLEYAELMGLLLSVMMLLVSGIWQLKIRLQGKQKNHADMYNLELLKLIAQINTLQELEKLKQLRQELFKILTQVVIDLDQDLITAESFQSFTFTWEVALTSLRHQELLLKNINISEQFNNHHDIDNQ